MRMMHESRLWVVHLMIKVLMRIRLLEVLVVHLRHRVEETGIVVVLLLLLINRPARGRRLRRRRRREAQLLHIFVFCCVVSPKNKTRRRKKNEATRLKCWGRETRRTAWRSYISGVLPFFQRIRLFKKRRKPQKTKKEGRYFYAKRGEELVGGKCLIPGSHPLSYSTHHNDQKE